MASDATTTYTDLLKKKSRLFSTEVPVWIVMLCIAVLTVIITAVLMFIQSNYSGIRIPVATQKTLKLQYGAMPALANSNYFTQVKSSFIDQKTSFIEADLSSMKLTVYQDGAPVKEVPIITKGKEGSWWETPAGVYQIETKEKNHFSSIGKVYQPYSMAFQGNFFIHGWPYYPDGTDVSSAYSGGCIRLNTEDAQAIYELAKTGMPVLVYEKDFTHDTFSYNTPQPGVTAKQYLIADLKSDSVIASNSSLTSAPIGSITKLLSALVAAEYIDLDKTITVSSSMLEESTIPRLYAGQQISTYNLMFPLLMENSNEAAAAVARQVGPSRFVNLMNSKATSLGMTTTNIVDVDGKNLNNTSTPEDLFALAKYLYNNRSFVLKISSGRITSSVYGEPVFKNLKTLNTPSGTGNTFVGGMLDTTSDNQTFLGIFEIEIQGEKRPIAVVSLGSQDALADATAMYAYVRAMYK
ncbi:MAG: hypothetical protein K0S38_185 [Candidatus Paceibacter sp.]|jgi:D-alanyl-D-alanine carboxypeptidase (penicillin-binding protein 5/6)|nr:hypothetical protein [Candidatus Paceibacter sp.]